MFVVFVLLVLELIDIIEQRANEKTKVKGRILKNIYFFFADISGQSVSMIYLYTAHILCILYTFRYFGYEAIKSKGKNVIFAA